MSTIETMIWAATAVTVVVLSYGILYWPQTSAVRDALRRSADRDADCSGLDKPQRAQLRRVADRMALDVHEGRMTLGDALHRISREASGMRT